MSKRRRYCCKIVILTSLVWSMLDLMLIFQFTNVNPDNAGNLNTGDEIDEKFFVRISNDHDDVIKGRQRQQNGQAKIQRELAGKKESLGTHSVKNKPVTETKRKYLLRKFIDEEIAKMNADDGVKPVEPIQKTKGEKEENNLLSKFIEEDIAKLNSEDRKLESLKQQKQKNKEDSQTDPREKRKLEQPQGKVVEVQQNLPKQQRQQQQPEEDKQLEHVVVEEEQPTIPRLGHKPKFVPWSPDGYGEHGKAVQLTQEEDELSKKTFNQFEFNIVASDKIALNRTLPDPRPQSCKAKPPPNISELPKTSVIIVFHNEAWTTLLRTVISVINMSPRQLLEEILLVDDASLPDKYWLQEDLDEYVAKLPVPTRVIRTGERVGLIQGRLIGLQQSKADVVTFLDSHCECNVGWLEPLMAEIAKDRTTVVSPIIDVISDRTFQYSFIDMRNELIGGFGWWLEFKWFPLPRRERDRVGSDESIPRRTPTIAGGLFSIDKKYFQHLGLYDPGFDTWGAENLEISFRVWQCGGTLVIHPCSHVGHVFRSHIPYKYKDGKTPGTTLTRNNMRLLDVWMDNIKYFYMSINPGYSTAEYGDTSERKILRQSLGCKDFNWYLNNIYPDNTLPLKYTRLGPIKNVENGQCVDIYRRKAYESPVLVECHGGMTQIFVHNQHSNLQHDHLCLAASTKDNTVKERSCFLDEEKENPELRWSYDWQTKTFVHMSTGKCLDRGALSWIDNGQFLTLKVNFCSGVFSQQWTMDNMPTVGKWTA